MITAPAASLWRTKERIVFEIQIPQALTLYKNLNPRFEGPQSHDEFMEQLWSESSGFAFNLDALSGLQLRSLRYHLGLLARTATGKTLLAELMAAHAANPGNPFGQLRFTFDEIGFWFFPSV